MTSRKRLALRVAVLAAESLAFLALLSVLLDFSTVYAFKHVASLYSVPQPLAVPENGSLSGTEAGTEVRVGALTVTVPWNNPIERWANTTAGLKSGVLVTSKGDTSEGLMLVRIDGTYGQLLASLLYITPEQLDYIDTASDQTRIIGSLMAKRRVTPCGGSQVYVFTDNHVVAFVCSSLSSAIPVYYLNIYLPNEYYTGFLSGATPAALYRVLSSLHRAAD